MAPSASETRQTSSWNQGIRNLVSGLLVLYLMLVVLAPLSNPVASADLTGPVSRFSAPLLRAFNLNHGYRFFGPEPGPSHLVVCSVTQADGTKSEIRIPDASEMSPRLGYHRWFMLSERIFGEFDMTPDEAAFQEGQMRLAALSDELKREGKFAVADRVKRQRIREEEEYRRARKRIDSLVKSLANYVIEREAGVEIELKIQERALPTPLDLIRETPLDDPKFLTTLKVIGRFKKVDGELRSLQVVQPVDMIDPTLQGSPLLPIEINPTGLFPGGGAR